jgi:hypothetical protein
VAEEVKEVEEVEEVEKVKTWAVIECRLGMVRL